MQSRHRVFAEDLLLPREEGEDHFDRVPDSLVLLIFNRLADARSLGRCSAVSKRFNALVPLVDDACLRIDRVITDAADADDALGLAGPRPGRGVLSHLLKAMLLAVLKPFGHCDAGVRGGGGDRAGKHGGAQQHHSPAQVLKNFSSIRNLRMELPVSDVGTDDGVLLRWKAVFGSTLQSCVILGGTRVDRAAAVPAAAATAAGDHEASQGDDSGSIPESFYTNGGLKLRVVWTISSLIAAATRHYLLREIVKEHPTLETVALTDAHGQGTLSMGRDQIKEFRDKPLAAAAAANRTQVPACNMKLRYAPMLELSDGTRIQGATLVVIKPVGEAGGIGGGRKELDEFVADAFDGPYREAVSALSKRRTYLLEMNGF
ncbi:F-box protein At4g18380-like [Oryza brachyantha]|uniref:F-box protein At4g18380-like n=1 Tax=Oryza brachyantha TaxID=4533 RepID=UPI001ADC8CB0|nr:F-box protein At4g18380-like [Oryza brachyantha]